MFLNIDKNPGIVAFQMTVTYDPSVLTPVAVENAIVWTGDIAANLNYAANKIRIAGSSTDMRASDGTLIFLVFDIKETAAAGTYPVTIEVNVLNTLDGSSQVDVPYYMVDGDVKVIDVLKGDVIQNNSVNAADATEVLRYVAKLIPLTNTQLYAADTLNRGIDKIDASDATRILLYSVGFIPSLPPQSAPMQSPSFAAGAGSDVASATELSIGSTEGNPGDIIQVPINISGNTGFSTFNFKISYDNSKLTPVGLTKGNVWTGDLIVNINADDGDGVNYIIVTAASTNNRTENGTIAYITFKINDAANAGAANINLEVKEFKYTDLMYNVVELLYSANGGTVAVSGNSAVYSYGDVDGDGDVGAFDLVKLSRHIAEIELITDPALLKAADVTGDGRVTIADLIRLARFIAGHDPTPMGK